MKSTIIFILALLLSLNVLSQISTNEDPLSFNANLKDDNIPVITMPALNHKLIEKEDSIDNLNGLPPRFGFDFDVDINMENSGRWIELPNKKGRLWQLEIYCPRAMSINLLYDKFYIPEGGKFFIYSPMKRKKLGAFTQKNNKGEKSKPGAFATSLILDEKIILEYYEPNNSNGVPIISISKVIHGYRFITPFLFGDSDNSCEVNINCPLGANWQDEKTSVAVIVVGGTRWCTGSLINNTQGDGAPYLLTANHCLNGLDAISNPIASTWTFLWNYESPTCINGTDFTPPSTAGATVVANNTASDFALLELSETPFDLSPSLCLYYNGWDKSGSTPANTIGIHHPAGDIRKISISNSSPSSDGNFWNVTFNQGIVEGGSSGSPLFNENSRVVGQLLGTPTADPISCQNQDGLAIYGKFSVSWNNSTDRRRRLIDWLDPIGTNPNTLDGRYLFPTNNCDISGTSLVCPSGATFTVTNPPFGATGTWSCTSTQNNLSIDQSTGYAYATNTVAGTGTVRAIIHTGCGDITLPVKNVSTGSLVPIISGPHNVHCGYTVPFVIDDMSKAYGTSFYWSSNILSISDPYSMDCNAWSTFDGSGYISCTVTTCGVSNTTTLSVVVNTCDYLLFTPNPATDETTVSLESGTQQDVIIASGWDMEVYDQSQLLKIKKTKLTGRTTTLNTSSWQNGIYIVRAKIGDEVITEKLVVKH